MSNFVFVIDTKGKPLTPCTPGMARSLLNAGKAAVFRMYPFTIILKKEVQETPHPITVKIDPGSKTTGIALLKDTGLVWAAELTHRGTTIQAALLSRHQLRRSRRNRKTRYRQPQKHEWSRKRKKKPVAKHRRQGWIAPSLRSRVHNVDTWVRKLIKFVPVSNICQELVRFDLQLLQNPEISGVEYQQGELQGYEVREYLLNKFARQCAYCGAKDTALEVEHIQPRSKGGSNRISNLTLACHSCNQRKGNRDIKEFLSSKPDVLSKVLAQAKAPLKDAAAVNTTRWALLETLKQTGLPISTGSGGKTKFNRTRLGLPKTHFFDAACVGDTPALEVLTNQPLLIQSMGHGTRQMCRTDKFGFPSRHVPRQKFVQGFQTGDIAKAVVPSGKKTGTYVGRVAVRRTGSFNLRAASGLVQGVSYKHCTLIHSKDGYAYTF